MKDKLLQMRVDERFLSKVEYLQKINGYKSTAETVRRIVEKEYRKENAVVESENKKHIICESCPHRGDCEEMPYDEGCDERRMK